MATLTTGSLEVPDQILDPWLGKIQGGSTIAKLSGATPMKFGVGKSMVFDIGEAEYVGEGSNKSGSTVDPDVTTVNPFKFHKTVRWTDEVMWADEDHQLMVVSQILDLIQPALSRALDFGVFHGINPNTGATVPAMSTVLADTTNVVYNATTPQAALDAADAAVLADNYVPGDVALSTAWASRFNQMRVDLTGQKMYPGINFKGETFDLEGHSAAVSRTVSAAGVTPVASGVLGFVGDFAGIRWGIQRAIGLKVIEYGDPDGGGDLQRNNQVAFRAEVVYGWGIASLDAFAVVLDPASS